LGVAPRTVLRWEIKNELPNLENQKQLIERFDFEQRDFQRTALQSPISIPDAVLRPLYLIQQQ
jgi:hypothetical protein